MSDNYTIFINLTCITIMLLMTLLLAFATRMKSRASHIALIVVLTCIPVYIYNTTRSYGLFEIAKNFIYPAGIVNTMLIPLLWIFLRVNLNNSFTIKPRIILHFTPTLAITIIIISFFSSITYQERIDIIAKEALGEDHWITTVNTLIIIAQIIVYFPLVFWHITKTKKYLTTNYSDSNYLSIKWIDNFYKLFAILFIIVMVSYTISPRTDIWLIPILNTLVFCYLIYNVIANPTSEYLNKKEVDLSSKAINTSNVLSQEQMEEYCRSLLYYLNTSKAYCNPDLSLRHLIDATGISENNISKSINSYLGQNFFELINSLRIDEVKRTLKEGAATFTIETIAQSCGFRSRSTFYTAFKKFEGVSPTQWIKQNR